MMWKIYTDSSFAITHSGYNVKYYKEKTTGTDYGDLCLSFIYLCFLLLHTKYLFGDFFHSFLSDIFPDLHMVLLCLRGCTEQAGVCLFIYFGEWAGK